MAKYNNIKAELARRGLSISYPHYVLWLFVLVHGEPFLLVKSRVSEHSHILSCFVFFCLFYLFFGVVVVKMVVKKSVVKPCK